METPEYAVDLPPSSATVLNLASKTLGVGSASCGPRPLPQYLVNSNATTFSYGLRLLSPNPGDLTAIARMVAPTDRPWPVLTTRDGAGQITLDANGDALSYSVDGTNWRSYAGPFSLASGGLLRTRSTAPNGQTLQSAVPLDAFVDRRAWKATASDFQNGEGNPEHVLDGDPGTIWHSRYSPDKPDLPHSLVVDMGALLDIKAVLLTPRSDGSNGRIADFDLFLSQDPNNFGAPVLSGTLPDQGTVQTLSLPAPRIARFLKIVVKGERSNQGLASLGELSVVPAG